MKGGSVFFPSHLLWNGKAAVVWLRWKIHPLSLDLLVSQLRVPTDGTSQQAWVRMGALLCEPSFWSFPPLNMLPGCSRRPLLSVHSLLQPKRAISVLPPYPFALLLWKAVNCWHRRRRFVSIKHKHRVVHFSDLGSQPTVNISGSALFRAHPHTFLIYHIWMEIRALNINDK